MSSEFEPIGYLVGTSSPNGEPLGLAAVCTHCGHAPMFADVHRTPVFAINIRPYRQTCYLCGSVILSGGFDVELFDGGRRSGALGTEPHLCVIPVGAGSILDEHDAWMSTGRPCTLCGRESK